MPKLMHFYHDCFICYNRTEIDMLL